MEWKETKCWLSNKYIIIEVVAGHGDTRFALELRGNRIQTFLSVNDAKNRATLAGKGSAINKLVDLYSHSNDKERLALDVDFGIEFSKVIDREVP